MLGEVGLPNGYYRYRSCRVNVSAAVRRSLASSTGPRKLQVDLIFAPENGMTGCWTELCGKLTFAWLLNAVVLQPGTAEAADALGVRAKASLAAADAYAAAAVREWAWIGPFDDGHGSAMTTTYAVEEAAMRTGLPPNLSTTYVGKTGAVVRWQQYRDGGGAAAPHLPLSALLPTRQLNTGSVAFAMARVHCAVAAGCARRIQIGMSDRGALLAWA